MLNKRIDELTLLLYLCLIGIGWVSIYASEYQDGMTSPIYDFSLKSGKQMVWLLFCVVLIAFHLLVNFRLYNYLSYTFYFIGIVLLVLVLFLGKETSGSRSWFSLGFGNIQPSEIAKYAVAIALANFLDRNQLRPAFQRHVIGGAMIGLPAVLVMMQGDTGTSIMFLSFLMVLCRGGMSLVIIVLGLGGVLLFALVLLLPKLVIIVSLVCIALLVIVLIGKNYLRITYTVGLLAMCITFTISLDYLMKNFLKPYQYKRIEAMVNPSVDPLGYGWNVTQSKIAIGSGGLTGKGYLKGTQTKLDFVPEESTDFIFCTIGEEWGLIGCLVLITIFLTFIIRLIFIAERQRSVFGILYGYGVAGVLFFHFSINIAMTLGLFPVVGIPLPFVSYGGSSLCTFTMLVFTLLKIDSQRSTLPTRNR